MVALVVALALGSANFQAHSVSTSGHPFFSKPFLLGAHRGGVLTVPENTVSAFRETSKQFPDILLETDVRFTKDGVPVLMHDPTVNRTTDGKGRVADFTFAELRRLDAGYRFSLDEGKSFPYRGKRLRVATLAEALRAAPKSRLEIDIKDDTGVSDEESVKRVLEVVRREKAEDRVLWASFRPQHLEELRKQGATSPLCYDTANGLRMLTALRGKNWADYKPEAEVLSVMKEHVAAFRLKPEEVRKIREKGVKFQIHTLNDPEEIRHWLEIGVDSILTDHPERLDLEIRKRGPLQRAYAHNDYLHPQPLLDALEQGFSSVEADIFLEDGELRVGHDRKDLRSGWTLEALYLDPLLNRVKVNGGSVHRHGSPFILLVDVKADGDKVVAELSKRLKKYRQMLTPSPALKGMFGSTPGSDLRPAVMIVLSGAAPRVSRKDDSYRYLFGDGRPKDLGNVSAADYPLISDFYYNHFKWRGEGYMPIQERAKLNRYVREAHQRGHLVRFWGAPDRPEVWRELFEARVDLINTDKLRELSAFLRANG